MIEATPDRATRNHYDLHVASALLACLAVAGSLSTGIGGVVQLLFLGVAVVLVVAHLLTHHSDLCRVCAHPLYGDEARTLAAAARYRGLHQMLTAPQAYTAVPLGAVVSVATALSVTAALAYATLGTAMPSVGYAVEIIVGSLLGFLALCFFTGAQTNRIMTAADRVRATGGADGDR